MLLAGINAIPPLLFFVYLFSNGKILHAAVWVGQLLNGALFIGKWTLITTATQRTQSLVDNVEKSCSDCRPGVCPIACVRLELGRTPPANIGGGATPFTELAALYLPVPCRCCRCALAVDPAQPRPHSSLAAVQRLPAGAARNTARGAAQLLRPAAWGQCAEPEGHAAHASSTGELPMAQGWTHWVCSGPHPGGQQVAGTGVMSPSMLCCCAGRFGCEIDLNMPAAQQCPSRAAECTHG